MISVTFCVRALEPRFADQVLSLADPDGLRLDLVFTAEPDPRRLEAFREMLLEVADDVLATVDLFASLPVPDIATACSMAFRSSRTFPGQA